MGKSVGGGNLGLLRNESIVGLTGLYGNRKGGERGVLVPVILESVSYSMVVRAFS